MKKFALGCLVGTAASAIAFIPLLFREHSSKFEFGLKCGIIAGRFEVAHSLEKEFGLYDDHTPYKVLISVKTADVISVETNGVKTVRVIP